MFSFSDKEIEVILLTVKVAFTSTLITLPFAIWISWILARKKFVGKYIIESFLTLPLVAPPIVTGYLLLLLLGRNGIFGAWLYEILGIKMAFNFAALVIASSIISIPLAIRTMKSAFELIDPHYEQAARTLGASKISTFFRVSMPLAMPGIISGLVLSFARSLGEFGATITFAGNIEGKTQTIALMVFSDLQIPGREMEVTRLVIVSILISVAAIIVSEYFNSRKKYLIR